MNDDDLITLALASDTLYPRDDDNRYRVYALRGDDLRVLCTCPTPAGVGMALVQIHDDQKTVGCRLADLGRIGVLDVLAGARGEWILLPWDRPA